MDKENNSHTAESGVSNQPSLPIVENDNGGIYSQSRHSLDKEAGLPTCRVCQCAESDKLGDIVLGFLGIAPVLQEPRRSSGERKPDSQEAQKAGREAQVVEFISPEGEVFVCNTDLETGLCHQDTIIELGCSCKNDLALVHYACALKWFISHGSTVCEICGRVAKNIRTSDFKKVVCALKDYEALKERTESGEPNPLQVEHTSTGIDPDAVAAIRRQRLSEISLWFVPHSNSNIHNYNQSSPISLVVSEQQSGVINGDLVPTENAATKWAVEGTGILLATGLLTVTLAWLIAPRVGKKTARSGLHILLGGICALTVVVFFRFFVLTRIKYGPARYWAILFVFWFLVFGIWASRTHGTHTT